MKYSDPPCIKRYPHNPILSPKDMPFPCERVYNPAACRLGDRYCLVLRIDQELDLNWPKQFLALAFSDDGYHFEVEPEPVLTPGPEDFGHVNDPRVTFIEGWYYLTYCSDPSGPGLREEGIHLCIARSRDLRQWERIYRSQPDNRNAVIFPEKINGLFARLDRPFRRGYRQEHGYDVWISYSPDMIYWGKHKLVLSHLDVAWGHHKIGPSAPPIKTPEGWLTLFHGAEMAPEDEGWLPWIDKSRPGKPKVYRAGIMLLDLDDPSRIIARCEAPLLNPIEPCDNDPVYRPGVVFPCGLIEEPNGELKIYYGASDTHIAVATARKDELVDLCLRNRGKA